MWNKCIFGIIISEMKSNYVIGSYRVMLLAIITFWVATMVLFSGQINAMRVKPHNTIIITNNN